MLNSDDKGAVAELAIALAAAKLSVPLWRPLREHSRADLVLEIGGRLQRVQYKWGALSPDGDVIKVRIGGCWFSPHGYVRTTYAPDEVELFGVYCAELDRCFLLPVELLAGRHDIWLRLTPPRNRQQSCITLASDFDFGGAIAQLGERVTGSHEVAGSSPASSTSSPGEPIVVGSNPFRDRLGYWMDRVAAGDEVVITRRGRPRIRLSPAGAPTAKETAAPTSRGTAAAQSSPLAAQSAHSPVMISSAPCGWKPAALAAPRSALGFSRPSTSSTLPQRRQTACWCGSSPAS